VAEGREVVTALTAPQVASLTRAVARRSRGQISLPAAAISRGEAIVLWQDVVSAFGKAEGKLLSPRELGHLRRQAWRISGGHAALSETSLSLGSGLAFWQLARRLGEITQRRKPGGLARAAGLAAIGLAATQLAACTSLFGGNIKGSFACSAPGGTCAPSTVIDDQALSVIQNARPMTPAGPYMRQPAAVRPKTTTMVPLGSGRFAAARDGMVHRERRVLKVVFPSFVDGGGNLHEPRIVHAVVDDGAWMQLSSGEPSAVDQIEGRTASLASAALTPPPLPVAAAPNEAPTVSSAAPVPNPAAAGLPNPEAVVAARAKGAALKAGNAIEAIRAEVQGRLAQTAKTPVMVPVSSTPTPPATVVPATSLAQGAPHDAAPATVAGAAKAVAKPANAPASFPARVEE